MFCLKFTGFSFCFLFVIVHHLSIASTYSVQYHPSYRPINSFFITFCHRIPVSFILTRPNSRFLSTKCLLVSILILLSGDIELNPGPLSFNVCTYNIRSLFKATHSSLLPTIISQHHTHLFCFTETWHNDLTTPAEIIDATPPNFSLFSFPRSVSSTHKSKSHVIGGGTAFLLHNACSPLSTSSHNYKSFEMSSITFSIPHSPKLTVFNIYRPPPSSSTKCRSYVSFAIFLSEFRDFLSTACTTPNNFLITGDFNIHIDDSSNSDTRSFLSLLHDFDLSQHVSFPTRISSHHTLDLVLTLNSSVLNPAVTCSPFSVSDHFPVLSSLSISAPPPPALVTRSFRCLGSINIDTFCNDILASKLISDPPSGLSELVNSYNATLSSLLDKHAPVKHKTVSSKPTNPWYTPALHDLKSACRRLSRIWSHSRSVADLTRLRTAMNHYHASIIKAKRSYFASLVSANRSNPRKLWSVVNSLLHRKPPAVLPSHDLPENLSNSFASFFSDKVHKLHCNLLSTSNSTSPHFPPPTSPSVLSEFEPATETEISKLISSSNDSHCELDPLPTSLLKKCSSVLLPTITKIVNLSLSYGIFPENFKACSVHPLLKKSDLDKELLSNYRPISHLSFLSKLTERIVKSRLTNHLSSNSLFNSYQSAYSKYHSTETALLSVHDHIIKAIGCQKITALCLLDLSAAFDTIDHQILLDRLSTWFGLGNTVLSWIRSYLSSRFFTVSVNGSESNRFQLLYGVPQGSVLGPLLFTLYTTPLSHIISSTTTHHRLYADDTQLFTSFSSSESSTNILLLQDTIAKVSSWMSANFLSLNPSKTEFLLVGHRKQLSKLNNITLSMPSDVHILPVSSARNLGVVFDSEFSFSKHISNLSKSCFSHIRNLRRIRSSLDKSTAVTIATSLIHSKLDYCNSLFLNLPSCQLNRLQSIINSAARAVAMTSKYSHITPLLKSLHWLKITERIHYKIVSLTYQVLQFTKPSYLYDLLSIQNTVNTRSSSIISLKHPSIPSNLQIINRSFTFSAPRLWNQLPTELRLPSVDSSGLGCLSLSPKVFQNRLKTYLFLKSFPP